MVVASSPLRILPSFRRQSLRTATWQETRFVHTQLLRPPITASEITKVNYTMLYSKQVVSDKESRGVNKQGMVLYLL